MAISVDYYIRLEQRRVQASDSVLATLARALRLDEGQQAYLYEIVGKTDARLHRRRSAQRMRPAMQRLLDQLAQTPVVVLGRRMDILAWNPMAAALYTDFGRNSVCGGGSAHLDEPQALDRLENLAHRSVQTCLESWHLPAVDQMAMTGEYVRVQRHQMAWTRDTAVWAGR